MKFEFEFFFFSLDFGFWFFFLLSLVLGFRLFSFFAFYLFRFSAAFRSVSALARHERRRNGRLDQFLFWKNFVRRKNAPPPRPPRPFFFNSSLPFRGTSHSYFSLSLLLSVPTSITPYQKKKNQVNLQPALIYIGRSFLFFSPLPQSTCQRESDQKKNTHRLFFFFFFYSSFPLFPSRTKTKNSSHGRQCSASRFGHSRALFLPWREREKQTVKGDDGEKEKKNSFSFSSFCFSLTHSKLNQACKWRPISWLSPLWVSCRRFGAVGGGGGGGLLVLWRREGPRGLFFCKGPLVSFPLALPALSNCCSNSLNELL